MEATAPNLPVYEPPVERKPAVLPPALANTPKPHSIIHKMVGKMLAKKLPRISKSKPPKTISKRKKSRVL